MKRIENKFSRLVWVNPESHYVYDGMLRFFSNYFSFSMYDANDFAKSVSYWSHKKLVRSFAFSFLGTFFIFFRDPFYASKDSVWIWWDIFTNALCLKSLFFRPHSSVFFSSHFIKYKESFLKKLLFYCYWFLFRRRKIIVPTLLAQKSFWVFSDKVFFFPQLYVWNLINNQTLSTGLLKILVVVGQLTTRKRIDFLLDTIVSIGTSNLHVWICGLLSDDFNLDYYQALYGNSLVYHWVVDHWVMSSVYSSYNLLVLPSESDPIGAVVVEAMAHSLPVVVSNNVWSSSYVEHWNNWFVFPYDDWWQLLKYIRFFLDPSKRVIFGKRSRVIVNTNHWYGNEFLLRKLHNDFLLFLSS